MRKLQRAKTLENVQNYYGNVIQNKDDFQTQACIAPGRRVTPHVTQAISLVHTAVQEKYYGCGLVIPPGLDGLSILDLGSGSGRDCFALSRLVGEHGTVVGIDMTQQQVDIAEEYVGYHTEAFGYASPNVRFITGYIEDLCAAGLENNSFDLIVSNCVIDLSPDKVACLSEAFRVLKPGGEFYFSDMYTDTADQPESVREDAVLWGEGFAGALPWEQLHVLARQVGFSKPFLVTASEVPVLKEEFKSALGNARFCSATYRLFKPDTSSPGPLASSPGPLASSTLITYKGDLLGHENTFLWDHATSFPAGVEVRVGPVVAAALRESRYEPSFGFRECAGVEKEDSPFLLCGTSGKPVCCKAGT